MEKGATESELRRIEFIAKGATLFCVIGAKWDHQQKLLTTVKSKYKIIGNALYLHNFWYIVACSI